MDSDITSSTLPPSVSESPTTEESSSIINIQNPIISEDLHTQSPEILSTEPTLDDEPPEPTPNTDDIKTDDPLIPESTIDTKEDKKEDNKINNAYMDENESELASELSSVEEEQNMNNDIIDEITETNTNTIEIESPNIENTEEEPEKKLQLKLFLEIEEEQTSIPSAPSLPIAIITDDEQQARVGYDSMGNVMPGFEDVNDYQLSFNCESDFAIFMRQINSEIPLQRLVAVKRMIKSCTIWGQHAVLSVLPRIQQLSMDKEMVIRQAIAEVLGPYAQYFMEASNDSSASHMVVISELLPLIQEMLKDAMEVRQGAGNSLIMIAELLNKEEVHEHVLKIVLHMAHDDSDDQKITALPLLGDLAPIVGAGVCKNYLSSDLHALSQDNSFRVRKATVQYFGPICEQLGADDAEKTLLPIFKQLCVDSIWSVRKGCVESFVDVANSIHKETRGELIPLMEKFLNDSSRWVRNTAYEILGPFISTLNGKQVKPEFLKYFTNIPHLSTAEADADCTNHCAFNFPGVTLTMGRDRWLELNDTYNILVRKTFKSRKTLACSIHEVCKVLGTELTEKYLINAIEFFLKDIDDIREGIIRNLWKILSVFGTVRKQEYIEVLWELASESDVNWRFRLLLAQQLDEILRLYPIKIVSAQLVPLIFQLCEDRMADVRYAACYPVADAIQLFANITPGMGAKTEQSNDGIVAGQPSDELLNNNTSTEDTSLIAASPSSSSLTPSSDMNEHLQIIVKRCRLIYNGRTYSKRLLYIRIACACFERLETTLFDKIFLNDLLNFASDKIFNVRFCLARFIYKYLYFNSVYNERSVVKKSIYLLKNDEYDIEVRRFFSTDYEIEEWLYEQKQLRIQQENKITSPPLIQTDIANENITDGDTNTSITALVADDDEDDISETDSSLYSTGSDDDGIIDDDDDDEENTEDIEETLDKAGKMLRDMKVGDTDISIISNMDDSNVIFDDNTVIIQASRHPLPPQSFVHRLVHQDTPYNLAGLIKGKLPEPDSDSDEDEVDDDEMLDDVLSVMDDTKNDVELVAVENVEVVEEVIADENVEVVEEVVADENVEVVEEVVADEQIADEQIADEQIVDEQIADEQIADERIVDEQIADERIADEQIVDDQIANDISNIISSEVEVDVVADDDSGGEVVDEIEVEQENNTVLEETYD